MVGRTRRQAAESAQVKIVACTIAENDGKEGTSEEQGQPLGEEFAVQLSNQAPNPIQEPENNGRESSQPNSANEESREEVNGLSETENESDKDVTEGLPDSQSRGDFLVSYTRP